MVTHGDWIRGKSKERLGHNFVRTVLEYSGYDVMDYGIENHNQAIVSKVATNYKPETNRRLLSMPDFIVVDKETSESWLVEVKHREFKHEFDYVRTTIPFRLGQIKDYLDFWKEATVIFTFNVKPYCLCIELAKVNWSIHLKDKFEYEGKLNEAWCFSGIYMLINNKFPKVTPESFEKALEACHFRR